MNFFRKKKENVGVSVSDTHVNEALVSGGFVLVNTVNQAKQVDPLPYAVQSNPSPPAAETPKVFEDIPFEFSPTYHRMLESADDRGTRPSRLKNIDWDSLTYDFRLEKSVIQ